MADAPSAPVDHQKPEGSLEPDALICEEPVENPEKVACGDVDASDVGSISKEDAVKKLSIVSEFMSRNYCDTYVTIFVDGQRPLLSVLPTTVDPYLVDQAAVHLNVTVCDDSSLKCSVLSAGHNLVKDEVFVEDVDGQFPAIMDEVSSKCASCCVGFVEDDVRWCGLFQRLRKSDLANVLIERYNNNIVLRSRACRYVLSCEDEVDKGKEESWIFSDQCSNCRTFLSDLDNKYMGGALLAPPLPITQEVKLEDGGVGHESTDGEDSRRRRGRPKGSRTKVHFAEGEANDENVPDNGEEKSGGDDGFFADPDFIYGADNQADPDHAEQESLGRGLRKRITTSRQKALLLTKRKRGRPPIQILPVDCSECGETFSMLKDYRRHCLEHTNSFACSYNDCVKRFKSEKDLDVHMRKHRGEKPYVCTECGKAYVTRQDLRLHNRKHTGERPYSCMVCDKSFARRSALHIHKISVHQSTKSYLCPECGAAFKANSALIDHRKRVHLQIKPHQCEYCKKDFFSRKDYGEHVRTHTGEKPFECQLCGKCFSRQNHLKRHVEGVHKGTKFSLSSKGSRSKKNEEDEEDEENVETTIIDYDVVRAVGEEQGQMIDMLRPTEAAAADADGLNIINLSAASLDLRLIGAGGDEAKGETREIIVEATDGLDLEAIQQHLNNTSGGADQAQYQVMYYRPCQD